MVARGDMGVEVNFTKLPYIQKEIIFECNKKGKLVITVLIFPPTNTLQMISFPSIFKTCREIFPSSTRIITPSETD